MRNLHDFELEFVTGAGSACSPMPPRCHCPQKGRDKRKNKGNNGFGNNGGDGSPNGKQDETR